MPKSAARLVAAKTAVYSLHIVLCSLAKHRRHRCGRESQPRPHRQYFAGFCGEPQRLVHRAIAVCAEDLSSIVKKRNTADTAGLRFVSFLLLRWSQLAGCRLSSHENWIVRHEVLLLFSDSWMRASQQCCVPICRTNLITSQVRHVPEANASSPTADVNSVRTCCLVCGTQQHGSSLLVTSKSCVFYAFGPEFSPSRALVREHHVR